MDEMENADARIETISVDRITRITLSRPPLNVLNIAMMHELVEALASDAVTRKANVVVLQATGKAFSAGVDVADHTPERMEEMLDLFHTAIGHVKACRVPTVALVKRSALGGGAELATSCDIVLAGDRAKFGQPEIQLGVFPPVAMVNLPGTIGVRRAAEMILTGSTVSAADAERMGLVNKVYPDDSFDNEVEDYIQRFTAMSRTSLVETKEAFRAALGIRDPLQALNMLEDRYLNRLMVTHDAKEGIAAFLDKREAVWTHEETNNPAM